MGGLIWGLLIFFFGLPILRWIYEQSRKADNKKKTQNYETESSNASIVFAEEHLEHILDQIIRFLQAYSTVLPDEWYHLYISQDVKRDEYSGNYYVNDGYLKFQITLGNWWNGILYEYPDIADYMDSIFVFDSQERTFTYTEFRTGSSTRCSFPTDKINTMLQKYLDNYESKHPGIHFERFGWGARLISK